MRIIASLAGAFLASALLLVIIDIYTPGYNLINLIYSPLFVIMFVIWSVSFGYATIEANLKKKIISVLIIEAVALTASSIYYLIKHDSGNYFALVLGISVLVGIIILRSKND